jgi:hypothetical protein
MRFGHWGVVWFVWAYGLSAQGVPAQGPQPDEKSREERQKGPEAPAPTVREPFSLELAVWPTAASPVLSEGKASTSTNRSVLRFPGHARPAMGGVISLPTGAHDSLRFAYFRTGRRDTLVAPSDLSFFATSFNAGDALTTNYTLQHGKISYSYLSYPAPAGDSRFLLKTLWEVHVTSVESVVSAPGKPTADSSGNFVSTSATGTRWFLYPAIGAGVEHLKSDRFRWNAQASGFGLPGRSTLWDAEVKGAYRLGRVEAVIGAQGLHIKTSPRDKEYFKTTLFGVYVGLRWSSRS